ncbi:methyltransferase-like protein 25 [Microcaecilia unicolor]|uniref:Methyltransferase-like protein 25 n=1 Tax=Microcaecilia unicolor TaxID=1415580 RepID=A0A6P7Z5U1_9AMPH|nr:methyltransferase-like protein 25 [Microcaecilia unicolor]
MAAGERSPLFSLPTVVVDRRELVPRLRALCRFLARALRLSRAHTVDFYARDVWQQLVGAAVSPDSVLLTALKPRGSRQTRPWDFLRLFLPARAVFCFQNEIKTSRF